MTYCRWAVSRHLLQQASSFCFQNGSVSVRKFYSLSISCKELRSLDISRLLKKTYLQLPGIQSCALHNRLGNDINGKQRELNNDNVITKDLPKNLIFKDCVTDVEVVHTPEEFTNKDHEKVSEVFPKPKEILNNLKTMLGSDFVEVYHKQQKMHTKSGKKVKTMSGEWKSSVRITWPKNLVFECESKAKSQSWHRACLKTLHYLYTNKHIDERGYPIYSDQDITELKKSANRPVNLHIQFEEETIINDLYRTYSNIVAPIIAQEKANLNEDIVQVSQDVSEYEEDLDSELDKTATKNVMNLKLANETEYYNPIYDTPAEGKDRRKLQARSLYLKHKMENMRPEKKLPITTYKDKIINTVTSNRVVVIRGAPGCGKSTRTPSYILDTWIAEGRGAECNVIVSQPRRVAALSLAARVAQERGDGYTGDTVGHQVRLSTRLPMQPGGGILYCTAGALLRRLATSPTLPGCTHLILDEAHERSADSDAVMTLSKRALDLNPNLKVIVMSATIDTELFSRYYDNCPILEIPGFTFPVQSYYLDDLRQQSKLPLFKTVENTSIENDRASINVQEVVQVVKWIHSSKPQGAILVFLPGWDTIKRVKDELENTVRDGSWVVLPVHSKLSNEDQRKIFDHPMNSVRKIVLATNIAETSITIDDVVYVVDTGIHKEHRLLQGKGISSLDSDWISQASMAQRRGRAGRVKPGECYHMYTREKMDTFVENNIPEILRIPLEKTVLDCKTYNEAAKAEEFLGNFPQPPNTSAIRQAVEDLIELGALDSEERLTPLGRRIASYTTHPKISKALVHSTIFKVTSPMVDLAAIISNNIDIYSCSVQHRPDSRRMKAKFHPTSDHMALYWLCRDYAQMKATKTFNEVYHYCKRNNLRWERMNSVLDLRKICVDHLKQSKMLPPSVEEGSYSLGDEDVYSNVDELVKGVLLSGLNTMLTTRVTINTRGRLTQEKGLVTSQGQRAFLGNTSVNHGITKSGMNGLLVYCGAIHSQERRGLMVRETSLIHPLTAFLFSQKVEFLMRKEGKLKFIIGSHRITLECEEDQGECLLKLRKMIWSTVQYYIENKGFTAQHNQHGYRSINTYSEGYAAREEVEKFKNRLVDFLAETLNKVEIVAHREEENQHKKELS